MFVCLCVCVCLCVRGGGCLYLLSMFARVLFVHPSGGLQASKVHTEVRVGHGHKGGVVNRGRVIGKRSDRGVEG